MARCEMFCWGSVIIKELHFKSIMLYFAIIHKGEAMKPLRPIIYLAAFVLVVGLACSALGGGNTPAQPVATQVPTQPVSNPPTSTTAPEPTAVPDTAVPATTEAP